jgi:hypothetical protein
MVMKSGEDRNALAQTEDIIALEMEAFGVWELFPTIVIKSACDNHIDRRCWMLVDKQRHDRSVYFGFES